MGSTRFPCCVKQSDGGNFFFPFSSASCLLKPRRPEVSVLPSPAPGVPLPGSSPPKLTHRQLFTSLPAPPGATRATRRSLPTSHFADTHSLSSALLLAAAAMLGFFFFLFSRGSRQIRRRSATFPERPWGPRSGHVGSIVPRSC